MASAEQVGTHFNAFNTMKGKHKGQQEYQLTLLKSVEVVLFWVFYFTINE